jgi:hypothetical protein
LSSKWIDVSIATSKTNNPFRTDVGDVADFFSFNREFLKRNFSPKQEEVMRQVWSYNVEEWNCTKHLIILEIGMKGGKNWILESDACYTLYFLNCLKNKWDYFSKITKRLVPLTEDINFDIGNASAVDEKQARRAFFAKVSGIIKATKDPKGDNWFEKYAKLDVRETFGNMTQEAIEFPADHPGQGKIRLYSFNSAAKAPEGLHYFRFYFDEPSRANSRALYNEAKLVFELGENNTRASFPNRVAKGFAWSYPNDTDWDLIEDLYKRSFRDESTFGMKIETWNFNPSLTKEMLNDAFNNDPITANRIYGCIKPLSRLNFYQPHTFKIEEAINQNIINRVKYRYVINTRAADGKHYKFTGIELLGIEGDKRERCFAMDAGTTKDRFVIVGGYNETIDAKKMELFIGDTMEVITTNKRPVIDVMIVIEAKEGMPVDYLAIGQVITSLITAFPNIKSINSDHYQNEKFRQEILHKGIQAETYFFSNQMQVRIYTMKRWNVWNNNIYICKDVEEGHRLNVGSHIMNLHELWQNEAQRLIKDGFKITHPDDGSKDLEDGVTIVNYDLMQLEAAGAVYMGKRIEDLMDKELDALAVRYMDLKYELIIANTPKEEMNKILAPKLGLSDREIEILRKWVKETYDY